jgi:branched-chain amino acid transport system permease protein
MVIVGGVGTIYGPLLGSFFVVILAEIIRGSLAELSLLIFALVMILTMRFIRGGFMGLIGLLLPRLRKRAERVARGSSG